MSGTVSGTYEVLSKCECPLGQARCLTISRRSVSALYEMAGAFIGPLLYVNHRAEHTERGKIQSLCWRRTYFKTLWNSGNISLSFLDAAAELGQREGEREHFCLPGEQVHSQGLWERQLRQR